MKRWLSIVGIGEDGIDGLDSTTRELITSAEILIGGERHLAMIPQSKQERLTWRSPLSETISEIRALRGRRVCVLATGDPMWFGIGVTLARTFSAEEMLLVPGLPAFTLAASRLGWPISSTACITLHGRPMELLNREIRPGARILALSEDGSTPAKVSELLLARGFGKSTVHVLEHMGGVDEILTSFAANEFSGQRFADLNTVGIECVASKGAAWFGLVPGLPDEAFVHDGQFTKRQVRAVTLAQLQPMPGQVLWDVGAGSGSVSVEWLRSGRDLAAVAIEREEKRWALITENALTLGVPLLKVVGGEAPEALEGLPEPDAVFIGGGLAADGVFESCWAALKTGGRLVANVVTLEGEQKLGDLQAKFGGELTSLAVSHVEPVGRFRGWKPAMRVTQWAVTKPVSAVTKGKGR